MAARPRQAARPQRGPAAAAAAALDVGAPRLPGLDLSHAALPPAELTKAVKGAFREVFWGSLAAPRVLDSFLRLQARGEGVEGRRSSSSLLTSRRARPARQLSTRPLQRSHLLQRSCPPAPRHPTTPLQAGEELDRQLPGLGRQHANSYLEGLSATPFPDPYSGAYRWLEELEARVRACWGGGW